jgi:hypothetical protein
MQQMTSNSLHQAHAVKQAEILTKTSVTRSARNDAEAVPTVVELISSREQDAM